WKTPYESHASLERLNQLVNRFGFTAGYTADAEDVVWQCERFISNYELHSKSDDQLSKIFDPVWEREMIDVSRNPGRRTQFPGMWLQSSWRMWFGTNAFRFISPERILSFPHATMIQ